MAFAGGVGLRHGDLSNAVRRLPDAPVPVVFGELPRSNGRASRGHRLRAAEYCRGESGLDHFVVAVFRAVVAVRAGCAALAIEVWRTVPCCDHSDDVES